MHHVTLFNDVAEFEGIYDPGERGTDLEYTIIVHLLQGESKALCQHSVYPALHDGRHTEPVQRKLQKETQHVTLILNRMVESVFFFANIDKGALL